MRAAYVGLGNIGAPMARRLVRAMPDTIVYDVSAAARAAFADECAVADSVGDIGRGAEIVALCVRNDRDVVAVVDGADAPGLLGTMARGGIILVHSTVRPKTVIDLAARAKPLGITVMDAGVSGGPTGAASGTLTAMVGGDAAALEKARPVIDAYCSDVIHAGATGAGMSLKLCNNLVTYAELTAALEACRLADALGLARAQLTRVLTNNGNLTPSMRQFLAYREGERHKPDNEPFRAAQDAVSALGEKDLQLALEAARDSDVSIPMTERVRDVFRATVMKGL